MKDNSTNTSFEEVPEADLTKISGGSVFPDGTTGWYQPLEDGQLPQPNIFQPVRFISA